MDRKIQIQKRSGKTTRRGEELNSWVNLGNPVWAKVTEVVAREDYREDQFIAIDRKDLGSGQPNRQDGRAGLQREETDARQPRPECTGLGTAAFRKNAKRDSLIQHVQRMA